MDTSDYQKIRELFDTYLRLYASRDDSLTSWFSENFSGFTGGGDFLVKDRDEWVAITRQDFAQVPDPIRIELKDLAIQSLSATVAVTTGFFVIHLPIEDHILSRETARLVLIFHKESGGWKIVHSGISIPYSLVRQGEVYPLQELTERNQFLEKLVEERTTQLSEANEKLQRANHELSKALAEQKLTEEALREKEAHYRLLTENASDVVWKVDRDYVFTYISPADERLRGYRADEVLGHHVYELFDEEGIATLTRMARKRHELEQQGQQSGTMVFEARHRCKDGRWLWAEISSTPERDADGAIVGFYGITREITDRREREKELLQFEKLESLGVLAGGIAHDFNNILTGIMGNITFAQMFLDAEHESYKPLAGAEKAAVRAGELARQLLTFARGGEPIKKPVYLPQLLNETTSFVLSGSNVKGIIDAPDSIHAIEADEGQLNQVFHNIIINAAQAMPGGGNLTVTARNETLDSGNAFSLPAGSYARITFADQGSGISDADLKRIFDPYFTTKSSGNGLGLAMAHSIVNRHGGHIGVRSAPGNGTTFIIHLPAIDGADVPQSISPATPADAVHAGGAILVMDDEEIIRAIMTDALGYLGYQVTTCGDGAEAVERYQAAWESGKPYAAVILDLTIPGGMGGADASRHILSIDPKACLIVSSGYSKDPVMSDFGAFGFSGALAKPYKITELGLLLGSLLSAR